MEEETLGTMKKVTITCAGKLREQLEKAVKQEDLPSHVLVKIALKQYLDKLKL